jgi:hypothetical protein
MWRTSTALAYRRCVPDEVVAERLTLISELILDRGGAPLVLGRPVLIKPGHRYWFDADNSVLVVEDSAGGLCTYPCSYRTGPDAPR